MFDFIRKYRKCKVQGEDHHTFHTGGFAHVANTGVSNTESGFLVMCSLIAGLFFTLCFLGIIKGLIGVICAPKVGIYGLHLLIDLPRPLARYQEKSLQDRPVVYDVGGWPVHPDTLDKSVRILSMRTEFCLNVVFFLAYPLAGMTYLCGLCCCIKNLDGCDDDTCFKHVDVIKIKNEDDCGDRDCEYVRNAMQKSKQSLKKYCSDTCVCISEQK